MSTAGQIVKQARQIAGLSQVELARRSGVAQPTVSAYERGVQEPSFASLKRLVEATGLHMDVTLRSPSSASTLPATTTGRLLKQHARELVEAAKNLDATNLRVFGSVARGDDRPDSDIDFLVDLAPTVSLIGLGRIQTAIESILGRQVDVVPASGLKASIRDQVLREAIPLEPQ